MRKITVYTDQVPFPNCSKWKPLYFCSNIIQMQTICHSIDANDKCSNVLNGPLLQFCTSTSLWKALQITFAKDELQINLFSRDDLLAQLVLSYILALYIFEARLKLGVAQEIVLDIHWTGIIAL